MSRRVYGLGSRGKVATSERASINRAQVRRRMLGEEIEKALNSSEISETLRHERDDSPTLDYLRELTIQQLDNDGVPLRPAFKDHLASLRRAFPGGNHTRRFPNTPTPTLDRCIAAVGSIGAGFALVEGHGTKVNASLGYTSIVLIAISVLVLLLPTASMSRSRILLGQSIFLTVGSAGVLAASVSIYEVDEDAVIDRASVLPQVLVAGTACFAALALTFLRRSSESWELPPGISAPPLRISPVPPLTITVGGLLSLATIFALATGEGREISIVSPGVLIWPSFMLIGAAAAHTVFTMNLQPNDYLLDDLRRTEKLARGELSSEDVLPTLREAVNNFIRKQETSFVASKAPGLSEAFDPLFEIQTDGKASVLELVENMPGGAIGLAGPRGAGKSTIINSVCGARRSDPQTGLAVTVSAPVQYSAREFLLNLYDELCRSALGELDTGVRQIEPLTTRQVARVRYASIAYGLIVLLAGVVILFLSAVDLPAAIVTWGVVVILIGLYFVIMATIREAPGANRPPGVSLSLRERAMALRQEIHYQYKLASAWSGGTKTPLGIEASLGQSREYARREMTLPEIVLSIRDFLKHATESGQVLVGIDELDKMQSGASAVAFLNDIKGIFGVPKCFFLVSISEEAMSGFERRGLPFRDVFDSSLDEVVTLGPLSIAEAEELLNRRVLNVPMPFKELLYAFSGGFARDLIRSARVLVAAASRQPRAAIDLEDGTQTPDLEDGAQALDLEDGAQALVGNDLRRKMLAAIHSLRGRSSSRRRSAVVEWCLYTADAEEPTPRQLLERLERLSRVEQLANERDDEAELDVLAVALEMSAYVYFCITLLELFSPTGLYADNRSQEERTRVVELLARARGLFSANVLVAWSSLSEIRRSEGLAVLVPLRDFPAPIVLDHGTRRPPDGGGPQGRGR